MKKPQATCVIQGKRYPMVDAKDTLYPKVFPEDYLPFVKNCDPFNCTVAVALHREHPKWLPMVLNTVTKILKEDGIVYRYTNFGIANALSPKAVITLHERSKRSGASRIALIPPGGLIITLSPPIGVRTLKFKRSADYRARQRNYKKIAAAKRKAGIPARAYMPPMDGIRSAFFKHIGR
jgi:hypothetical protein